MLPAIAEMIAVCAFTTGATVALKEAVLDPALMLALTGTLTSLLVLASATPRAFGAFADNMIWQAVFPAPVKTVCVQDSDFS